MQKSTVIPQISHKIENSLMFSSFSAEENQILKKDFDRFCLAQAKRACAMRRATSDTAFKTVYRDRWMHRAARLRVNQGESEGVYDCTRPRMSPPICP